MTVPALALRFSDATESNQDLASAALLDFDTAAIHEITAGEWHVFFRTREERDRAAPYLRVWCEVTAIEVEAEDWARKSQEGLRAIAVGDLMVAPPWDVPSSGRVIVIEPSTGFGTAHHATTRLCLRALQAVDVQGKRVLDIGTGSGVLGIAAAMLGAAEVIAVDNDADALAAARDNVARNGVRVDVRAADLERDRLATADIVLANLTGAMLERAAPELAALSRGGTLIVSGLLIDETTRVRKAFDPFASQIRVTQEDGWGSLTCTIP